MEYIDIAYTTCLSWCIPLMAARGHIFTFLTGIFQPEVWAAYIATVFVVVIILTGLRYWTGNCLAFKDIFHVVFIVFSPMPTQCRSSHIRIVMVCWVFSCLVLRTAYEGELKVKHDQVIFQCKEKLNKS